MEKQPSFDRSSTPEDAYRATQSRDDPAGVPTAIGIKLEDHAHYPAAQLEAQKMERLHQNVELLEFITNDDLRIQIELILALHEDPQNVFCYKKKDLIHVLRNLFPPKISGKAHASPEVAAKVLLPIRRRG